MPTIGNTMKINDGLEKMVLSFARHECTQVVSYDLEHFDLYKNKQRICVGVSYYNTCKDGEPIKVTDYEY